MSNQWPQDEALSTAVSVGSDFAGLVTFHDLTVAMHHHRHRVLSCYRRESAAKGEPNYEVVLSAIR